MKRLAIVLWTLMLFVVQPVTGQFVPQDLPRDPNATENLKFNDTYYGDYGSVLSSFGTVVGPYKGQLGWNPTDPAITLYCIDKFNFVSYGQQWTANATALNGSQSMGNTRLGMAAPSTALQRYRQVAFLAALFETTPATSWAALHAAIWSITAGPTNSFGLIPGNPGYAQYETFRSYAATADAAPASAFNNWYVMTDVRANGQTLGAQEYLVRSVVPEPQTYILLLSGLAVILFVARRRLKEDGYA